MESDFGMDLLRSLVPEKKTPRDHPSLSTAHFSRHALQPRQDTVAPLVAMQQTYVPRSGLPAIALNQALSKQGAEEIGDDRWTQS